MAIFGPSFQIGRSALAAYQAALTITGQNIAIVGNPDYTRQSGRLAVLHGGTPLDGVAPGAGVNLDRLQRHIDEAVEARLRLALGARSGAETTYQTLNRIEGLYSELTDYDLSSQLSDLFGSFANLQTDPAGITARDLVLSSADAVIRTLHRQRTGLLTEVSDLNDAATGIARSANRIAEEIADLNEQIVVAEARGRGGASALKDRRDSLLRDLAELMDVQTRAQDNGVVNVYVGSEPLVEFNRSRGLTTRSVLDDGLQRVTIRYADNNGSVTLRNGRLAAIVEARDVHLAEQLDKLDQLARGLIYEVNRVHSTGRGLLGCSTITGTYAAGDAVAVLNSTAAGLTFPVQNGTLLVHIRDQKSGQTVTRLIEVDLDGLLDQDGNGDITLNGLATALNGVPGLTATVTADNRLQLDADAGLEISFSEDSSGVLAALGVGTFFDGTDAATLAVHSAIRNDPRLIATSLNGEPGDGSNAGRLAAVGSTAGGLLGNLSIQDFHQSIIHLLAVNTAAAETTHEAADAVYSSLLAQREAVSGVSLDEEAINLTKFERSYQGASRFLTVLDSLTDEVLALVT